MLLLLLKFIKIVIRKIEEIEQTYKDKEEQLKNNIKQKEIEIEKFKNEIEIQKVIYNSKTLFYLSFLANK